MGQEGGGTGDNRLGLPLSIPPFQKSASLVTSGHSAQLLPDSWGLDNNHFRQGPEFCSDCTCVRRRVPLGSVWGSFKVLTPGQVTAVRSVPAGAGL
jgi:hypothetical protein